MLKEMTLPPYNSDAEKSVLGAMILSDESIGDAVEYLDEGYFYETAHQKIFAAIKNIYSERKNIDLIVLSDYLKDKNLLDSIGGISYLAQIVDLVPTTANVRYYIDIVKDKGVRRQLIKNAGTIVRNGYDTSMELGEVVDESQRLIFEVAEARQNQQAFIVKDLLRKSIETIDKLCQRKESVTGVSTGFLDLDKHTAGLQKSELIIVAARPGMGKSALAMGMAQNACLKKKTPVAVFSLEMSKEHLIQRMLCSQAMVRADRVRTGFLSHEEWPMLTKAASELSEMPMYIDDTPAISVLELRAKARRLKSTANIGLIIVDYLQLMRSGTRTESRQQEISEISRSLKSLSRELDVPLVALSQLSRAVEGREVKKPQLSDLRESGAIEQDADVVLLIMREDYYNPTMENQGVAEINIAKQRNGISGISVKLKFIKEYVKFVNLDHTHHE